MQSDPDRSDASRAAEEFDEEAARPEVGIVREFFDFLVQDKKWWLAPIILVLLLLGGLVILAGTGAAPFIYTLF